MDLQTRGPPGPASNFHPVSHPSGRAILDGVRLQHDGTLIEDKLARGLFTAFDKELEANELGEIFGDEVIDELAKEAFADSREIGERVVLVLVGAEESILAEDGKMWPWTAARSACNNTESTDSLDEALRPLDDGA